MPYDADPGASRRQPTARFIARRARVIKGGYGLGITSPHFSQVRNSSESKNV